MDSEFEADEESDNPYDNTTGNIDNPESSELEIEDEDVPLSNVEDILNEVLGETGLTDDELVEIVEEEVPLVSDPAMSTNSTNGGGLKKGWMLAFFFLLLLIIAILIGRAAYKKIESRANRTDEE